MLIFFRKLNIDDNNIITNHDFYYQISESPFELITQNLKDCNNNYCRSDYGGNFIFKGYFNNSYIAETDFVVYRNNSLYPGAGHSHLILIMLFMMFLVISALPENCDFKSKGSSFLRYIFRIHQKNDDKAKTYDPGSILVGSMVPCDILGNTFRSSNFIFTLTQFIEEINKYLLFSDNKITKVIFLVSRK